MAKQEILVIGASRGLGLGLVKEYLKRGWNVTATVRDKAKATELNALAAQHPGAVTFETVDIDKGDQVAALAKRLGGKKYDLIFVNAGVSGPQDQAPSKVSAADVAALFYTNAVAPINVAEKLVDSVKPNSGVLAFMSSRVGSVSEESPGFMPLYRASKAALNSMTKSFLAGIKDKPITVLSMHPGWVKTDMGGPDAPVDVPTSVPGLANVIAKRAGSKKHAFVDFEGADLAW